MKRSPLRRKTPLRPKTHARSSPPQPRRPVKQTRMAPIPASVRKAVLERDNGCCVLCGGEPTDIGHVRSRGAGGRMERSNLCALCHEDHMRTHQDPSLHRRMVQIVAEREAEALARSEAPDLAYTLVRLGLST